MSLATGHTLGATIAKHDSNCLICNQCVLGLGEDFGQVSLSNVNSLCEILSFPKLGGLELGSSKALIAFCNDCGGRVETFKKLVVQLDEIMSQMEGIRLELTQQLLESAKNTNGYAYIINTRNLFAQLLGVQPQPQPSQVLSMPNTCESIRSAYPPTTFVNEENLDSRFVAVPSESFNPTQLQTNHEDQGQETFSDGYGNTTAHYLQHESSTSDCLTPAPDTFIVLSDQEECIPPPPDPSDSDDEIVILYDEHKTTFTPKNTETGPIECAFHMCNLYFETEQEMLRHFNCHYPQMFRCAFCPKVCKTRFSLNRHMVLHDTSVRENSTFHYQIVSPPFKCTHRGCAEGFGDQAKLSMHLINKHNGKHPSRVNGCETVGGTREPVDSNNVHIVPPSKKPKLYQCTFEGCTELFEQKHSMHIHKGKVHKSQNQSSDSKSKDMSNSRTEPEVIDVLD